MSIPLVCTTEIVVLTVSSLQGNKTLRCTGAAGTGNRERAGAGQVIKEHKEDGDRGVGRNQGTQGGAK